MDLEKAGLSFVQPAKTFVQYINFMVAIEKTICQQFFMTLQQFEIFDSVATFNGTWTFNRPPIFETCE